MTDRWQPIETAPREGFVWLYEPNLPPHYFVASWTYTSGLPTSHRDYWEGWTFADEILVNHCIDELEPTHWMPLPEAPEDSAAAPE